MSTEKSLYTMKRNNHYGLMDASGKTLVEPIYDFAFEVDHGYGLVEKDGVQGLVDNKGNFVIKLEHKSISVLDQGLFGIKKEDKVALFNLERKQLTDFIYYSIFPFSENLAVAFKDGGMGYLDVNGKEIIPCRFGLASSFEKGVAVVKVREKYGLINKLGEFVQEPKYDWCRAYENCYHVNIGGKIADDECYSGKSGLLSKEGAVITALIFDDLDGFEEGLSNVRQGDLFGKINEQGELVVPTVFKQRVNFSEDLAPVMKKDKYGYVNIDNKFVIPPQFSWAGKFNDGFAAVSLGELHGFIDKKGNFVRPLEAIKLLSFREGSWEFKQGGKYGLMDHKGTILIPAVYESITNFYPSGYAWAKQDGLFGIINKKNEFALQPTFPLKTLYPISADYTHVEFAGKSGLLSTTTFEWIIPHEYDSIGVFKGSVVELKKNGKLLYANRLGEIVWSE